MQQLLYRRFSCHAIDRLSNLRIQGEKAPGRSCSPLTFLSCSSVSSELTFALSLSFVRLSLATPSFHHHFPREILRRFCAIPLPHRSAPLPPPYWLSSMFNWLSATTNCLSVSFKWSAAAVKLLHCHLQALPPSLPRRRESDDRRSVASNRRPVTPVQAGVKKYLFRKDLHPQPTSDSTLTLMPPIA